MITEAFRTWFQDYQDQASYDEAIQKYRQALKYVLVDELAVYDGHFNDSELDHAVEAIMALPRPVRRRNPPA